MIDAAKLESVITAALRNVGVNLHGGETRQVASEVALFFDVSEAAEPAPPPQDSGGEATESGHS